MNQKFPAQTQKMEEDGMTMSDGWMQQIDKWTLLSGQRRSGYMTCLLLNT